MKLVPMIIPMGSYAHSYGFLKVLWVPMTILMGSYENSSYDNSYGFLCAFLWVPMQIPMGFL